MPPPDATPEEIGEFWDTYSLADYWDEIASPIIGTKPKKWKFRFNGLRGKM